MERATTTALVEALLMAAEQPLSLKDLRGLLPEVAPDHVADALRQLAAEYPAQGGRHGVTLVEVGGGWRFRTRDDFAPWLARLQRVQPQRLGRAALEVLAVVAWRQPVSRAEIEAVRGVDCGGVLQSLIERELIAVVARRDMPGRPVLYGTTPKFLEVFGLRTLDELPSMESLERERQQARLPWAAGPGQTLEHGEDTGP